MLEAERYRLYVRRGRGPCEAARVRENLMSNLFTFVLVVQALVAAAMIGVILMQKSEGGGLGVGGSPAGLLSARGAADFMTRATTVLATAFVALSIVLAAMASVGRTGSTIDTSLSKTAQPQTGGGSPLTGAVQPAAQGTPGAPIGAAPAPASDDPLAAAAAASQSAAPAPAQGNQAPPAKK
jgi:preprotein translocase subunit SecG